MPVRDAVAKAPTVDNMLLPFRHGCHGEQATEFATPLSQIANALFQRTRSSVTLPGH